MRYAFIKIRDLVFAGVIAATVLAGAGTAVAASGTSNVLGEKIRWVEPRASSMLLSNVSRSDAKPGSVIASPTKREPNYYYHWVRDGALTMMSISGLEQTALTKPERDRYRTVLLDYVTFSETIQHVGETSNSYAEARFQVDGTIAYDGWASPQTDGPALRAVSLIQLANRMLDEGSKEYVTTRMYRSEYPATTVIKKDLEFITSHWRDASYDVWEESFGSHFYHFMVQRRAFFDGAALAERLGDTKAATFYRAKAGEIAQAIDGFFDQGKGHLVATTNWVKGVDYKSTGLDMVTVLGVLHGATSDGFMGVTDDRVVKTISHIEKTFWSLYPLNAGAVVPSVGRYPEDRYDGANSQAVGNPWFITTFAMSEYYAKYAEALVSKASPTAADKAAAKSALEKSDRYMESALAHINQQTGQMSEQFNRWTGVMQGAADLTWSYASFFTADWANTVAHKNANLK